MSNTRVTGFPDDPEEHTGLIVKFTEGALPGKHADGQYLKSMRLDDIINQIQFPTDNCNVKACSQIQE